MYILYDVYFGLCIIIRLRTVPLVPIGPSSLFQGLSRRGVNNWSEEEEESLDSTDQGEEGG